MDLSLKFQKTNVGIKISIIEIWVWSFRKLMSEKESTSLRYYVCQFPDKMYKFDFLAQICPKMELGLEIQKNVVRIRFSILGIICVPIFRQNRQFWLFLPKFAQKWVLGLELQKSKSGFGISTSKTSYVPIFSQNGQLWIFRTKFEKTAQLCAIFWVL